jgi:hypothetical protein
MYKTDKKTTSIYLIISVIVLILASLLSISNIEITPKKIQKIIILNK